MDGTGYGPCVGEVVPIPDLCITPTDEDCIASAQPCVQATPWSKAFSSTNDITPIRVAVDTQGNVVIAGQLMGTANLGGADLVGSNSQEIFVAKFDAAGTHLWSKKFGSQSPMGQYVYGLAVDPSGNTVVCGDLSGTIDFGGGPLTSVGARDTFVAKLDAFGNHVWSKRFGEANGDDTALDCTVDFSGNPIVVGYFHTLISFGGPTLNATTIVDTFAAKLDGSDGSRVWSKRFGHAIVTTALTSDPVGNIFWTGGFNDVMDFGTGPLSPAQLGSGNTDMFVVKLSSAGAATWVKTFSGLNSDDPRSIALDAAGNLLLAGIFNQNLNLGGGVLTMGQGSTGFVAKLDNLGGHVYSRSFFGSPS